MHAVSFPKASTGVLALLLSTACATEPDFGGASVDVDSCAGDADQQDALSMVLAFGDSAQELLVCGAITYQFLGAVVGTADSFAEGDEDWEERLTFDEGTYRVEGTGVAMDLSLTFGEDTPGGTPGEPVSSSLFVSDSWLVDATATQDGEDLVISFSEPGPLAALLGKGPLPQSPLTLSSDDLDVVALNLTTLVLEARVAVEDQRDTHAYTYQTNTPATSIESLIVERALVYALDEASGARPSLDQQASVSQWDLRYLDGPNPALQGTVTLDITGGPFDHTATYLYLPEDPEPSVTVTCP